MGDHCDDYSRLFSKCKERFSKGDYITSNYAQIRIYYMIKELTPRLYNIIIIKINKNWMGGIEPLFQVLFLWISNQEQQTQ